MTLLNQNSLSLKFKNSKDHRVSICFVTNQLKTQWQIAIAKILISQGHEISFISTGKRWTSMCLDAGISEKRILDISVLDQNKKFDLTEISKILQAMNDFEWPSLSTIISMDRERRYKNGSDEERYLHQKIIPIYNFLNQISPDMVLGEHTWAIEILIAGITRATGSRYIQATTIRIPSVMMGLFEGLKGANQIALSSPSLDSKQLAKNAIENVINGVKPYYVGKVKPPCSWRSYWLEEMIQAFKAGIFQQSEDHSVPKFLTRIIRRLRWRWNTQQITYNSPWKIQEKILEKARQGRYVLAVLQKEPEASIDVWAWPFSDQIATLRQLATRLPPDVKLIVKEHPAAVGCRSLKDYKRLTNMPNIVLASFDAQIDLLIKDASFIVSGSGTVVYEAAVLGIPCATFGDIFFAPALSISGLDPYHSSSRQLIKDLLDINKDSQDRINLKNKAFDFCSASIAAARTGRDGDPGNDPSCMHKESLCATAAVFIEGAEFCKNGNKKKWLPKVGN